MKRTITKRIKQGILLFMAVLLGTISHSSVSYAITNPADNEFYSSNDILFYNNNGGSSYTCSPIGGGGSNNEAVKLVGGDVPEKIFNFLTTESFKINDDKPLTAEQATGMMGNFQQESSMNPKIVNKTSGASGIAQWLGGRLTGLKNHASSLNSTWDDLSVQLSWLKKEMESGYEYQQLVRGNFADAKTPADAAAIWAEYFERAGAHEEMVSKRVAFANEYFKKYGGGGTSGSSESSGSGDSTCPTGEPTGDYMDDNTFVSFSQCAGGNGLGGPWGTKTNIYAQTMCNVGCGPTSVTMVIRNMTGKKITPEDARKYYNDKRLWYGFGTGPEQMRRMAKDYGLRAEAMNPRDLNEYRKIFDNGGLVVIGGQGSKPFYPGFGHFVVVRGITADGKLRISDPGRGEINDFTPESIFASINGHRVNNATAFYNN